MAMLTAKQELMLEKGWMNSAGALGFNPPLPYWQYQPPIAYVTPPLTEKARPPAVNRKVMRFAGGVLLHNGGFNPGLRTALKENTERWARSKIPVWVHLLLEDPHSAERMLAQVETCSAVTVVEISLPQEWSAEQSAQILRSLRSDLPLVLRVPLNQMSEEWIKQAGAAGFCALTIGAPLGSLPDPHWGVLTGWLYGPALFPLALQTLLRWGDCGLPLILGCGLFREQDVITSLQQGAAAVQLDAILWQGGIF